MVQAVNAHFHSDEVLKSLKAADVVSVRGVHQGLPRLLGGVVLGSGGQPGVLVGVVGLDDEPVALVVNGVLVVGPAGRHHQRVGTGVGGGEQAHLGGNVVAGADDDVFL